MRICYVDEAGCTGALPSRSADIQPVFVLLALLVEQVRIRDLTYDFLDLKRRFFRGLIGPATLSLDAIKVEIKGADIRRAARSERRRERRAALGFLDHSLRLLEAVGAQVLGRVWIKRPTAPSMGVPFTHFQCRTFAPIRRNICAAWTIAHSSSQTAETNPKTQAFLIPSSRRNTRPGR